MLCIHNYPSQLMKYKCQLNKRKNNVEQEKFDKKYIHNDKFNL